MHPRIFLSSTFVDLHTERAIVLQTARDAGWEPVYFETTHGLEEHQVLSRVHRDIRSCDAFLNLHASRYGSPAPQLPISYTHFEFALARKLGKPIISLILTESELTTKREKWNTPSRSHLNLEDLRKELVTAEAEGQCLRREYSSQTDSKIGLSKVALATLVEALRRYQSGQFRSAPRPTRSRVDAKLHRPTGVLGQLNLSNDILINRRFAGEQVKGEFSQYFWDYNLPLVCSKTGQMQLFFGSGSTAVFLLHAFRDALHWTRSYGLPRIKLFTNNSVLLTQLLVDELKDMNCDTYIMPGVVDHQYGATRIGEMAPPWFEFMRRPSGESRGLFVFGASLPRNDDPISPGAIDSFRVMRLANESLGYAGVLFLNESNREEDLTADRLTAFLEEGLGSPLPRIAFALSIASRSAKQRDRLWGTLERCRLRPIEPTYHDAEYRHSFPLTALSSNFPTAFGHLIG